jgi:hypothetical protein
MKTYPNDICQDFVSITKKKNDEIKKRCTIIKSILRNAYIKEHGEEKMQNKRDIGPF